MEELPKKPGRPKGASVDKVAKTKAKNKELLLKALINSNGILKQACDEVGIARSTISNYLASDIEFSMAVDDIREGAIDKVESALYNQISSGNTIATIFYLKCRAKNRGYVDKSELDVNVNEKITITYVLPEAPQIEQISDNENITIIDIE